MPVCPKCRKLISESHYERHLKRCGISHRHVTQSLYVPSATAQIESPNRGITYGPPSASFSRSRRWRWLAWGLVCAAVLLSAVIFLVAL